MKTKRILALLLALAMLCAMLAGCGGSGSKKPVEHVKLSRGAYEAYDDGDDLAGYLLLTREALTAYDEDGELDEVYEYEYDADATVYLIDDDEAFYVDEDKNGDLTLTTCEDGDVYRLEEIEKEDIPGYVDETAEPEPAPETPPEPEPEPETPPEPEPEPGPETPTPGTGTVISGEEDAFDTWGDYYYWSEGEFQGELDCWGDTIYVYDDDGTQEGTLELTELGGGQYRFSDPDTGDAATVTARTVNGQLRLYNETGEYLVLVGYFSVDDPYTYDPDTGTSGGSAGGGSAGDVGYDGFSGRTELTTIAEHGGVRMQAQMPSELAACGEFESASDSSSYQIEFYDDAGNYMMLMAAMGYKADIPAATLQDLADAVDEQVAGLYGDYTGGSSRSYTSRIAGQDWYVTEFTATEQGQLLAIVSCSTLIDDEACIIMAMLFGSDEAVDEMYDAFDDMTGTITID